MTNNDIGNVPASYDKERQARIDMFACAAMQGMLSLVDHMLLANERAIDAYDVAEAMEAERERRIHG